MKIIFTLFALIILLNAKAQTAEKWDLRKCVEYAMKNNISVKQADVQARIAALQLKQIQLYKYPSATFNTSIGPQFGRSIDPTTNGYTNVALLSQSYSLQGGMQVYNWGSLKNNLAAQQFNAQAALVDIEKAANDVALSVATYYLAVLASYEQISITKIQIAQTLSQLDVTRKKVDAGSLPELNALELETQLASDSTTYISAKSSFDQNILSLKGLLNIDAALPFDIEIPDVEKIHLDPLTELEPESVFKLAISHQPDIRASQLRIKGGEKSLLAIKSGMYPSVTASYSLATTYNNKAVNILNGDKIQYFNQLDQNFRQGLGLGISVPIFNNGTNRINYEKFKLTLQDFKVTEDRIELKLKQDIYTAYTNVINALQKFNAGKRSVESSQKAYDFAMKRYEVGLLSTLDLITNQNNLLRAKSQQIANQYDYVFKMKLLEFYKGQGLKL